MRRLLRVYWPIMLVAVAAIDAAQASGYQLEEDDQWSAVVLGGEDTIPIDAEDDIEADRLTMRRRKKREVPTAVSSDKEDIGTSLWSDYGSGDGSDLEDGYDDDEEEYYLSPAAPDMVSPSFDSYLPGHITPPTATAVLPSTLLSTLNTISIQNSQYYDGSGNDDLYVTATPTVAVDQSHIAGSPAGPAIRPTATIEPSRDNFMPPRDSPPYVKHRMKKLSVTLGVPKRILIPVDTFYDVEDGNARHLKLDLFTERGLPLSERHWLTFHGGKREILAMPVDANDIGMYKFNLTATDTSGNSISEDLDIRVLQHSATRTFNHQFLMEFDLGGRTSEPNWHWQVFNSVARLISDSGSNMVVRQLSEAVTIIFAWSDAALLKDRSCPMEDIRRLLAILNDTVGSRSAFEGALILRKVSVKYEGSCAFENQRKPSPPVHGDSAGNSAPVVRNKVPRINITAGELLRYKIPEDTCFDIEDGEMPNLSVNLLSMNRHEIPMTSWIQFDSKNNEIFGVPLEDNVGREEYQLVCADHQGLSAVNGVEIVVTNRPFNERAAAEVTFVFARGQGRGRLANAKARAELVSTVASHLQSEINLIIIQRVESSRDEVTWAYRIRCDKAKLRRLKNKMFSPSSDADDEIGGAPNTALADKIERTSGLQLQRVLIVGKGHCAAGGGSVPPRREPDDAPNDNYGQVLPTEYMLTFIIPAVIIGCMLLLAVLLACVLHRKRKAGKLNLFYAEALPPRVPVILQDELFSGDGAGGFLNGGGDKQRRMGLEEIPAADCAHRTEMDRLLNQLSHANTFSSVGSPGGDPVNISRPAPSYQHR